MEMHNMTMRSTEILNGVNEHLVPINNIRSNTTTWLPYQPCHLPVYFSVFLYLYLVLYFFVNKKQNLLYFL